MSTSFAPVNMRIAHDFELSPVSASSSNPEGANAERLRSRSRSRQPYHRQQAEPHTKSYLEAQGNYGPRDDRSLSRRRNEGAAADTNNGEGSSGSKSVDTLSDSGTEADDESATFLKSLPAPPSRPHKGLRDTRGTCTSSPFLTPSQLDEDDNQFSLHAGEASAWLSQTQPFEDQEARKAEQRYRRRRRAELIRRTSEFLIVGIVGLITTCGGGVRQAAKLWHRELYTHACIIIFLFMIYPIRLLRFARKAPSSPGPGRKQRFRVPSSFDPAPLIYPVLIPELVALSLLPNNKKFLLPNLILGIAALPHRVIPEVGTPLGLSFTHWFLSIAPLITSEYTALPSKLFPPMPYFLKSPPPEGLSPGILICLYPLHQTLLSPLQYLTTTSLLPAEIQLLSIALINLLLHSSSPQAVILQAALWGGGLGTFILCRHVIQWGVALAKIPKWRFRRAANVVKAKNLFLQALDHARGQRIGGFKPFEGRVDSGDSDADEDGAPGTHVGRGNRSLHLKVPNTVELRSLEENSGQTMSARDPSKSFDMLGGDASQPVQSVISHRRYTLPSIDGSVLPRSSKFTSGGRHRRHISSTFRPYLDLTASQAKNRKLLYAAYVYCSILFILVLGIRTYTAKWAFNGDEPVGWAIGYLLGNIQPFRMAVVGANMENWIQLPPRRDRDDTPSVGRGWVDQVRFCNLGEANTRLAICGYWLGIFTIGMLIVLRLSSVVEVDTRRKVFHGMMVAMFLPATYIDPAFAGLALTLALSLFILLDLFRASQLPPLSKPLAAFLTPYVDGRDLRGPVVVSHMFLLIGCAIPLWLCLADASRAGPSNWDGWEVTSRDVSMISGVVCVGMGDAAASLIGRRYGRRKWPWTGGKSLEGSVAFALAVASGLVFARFWLVLGGWPGGSDDHWVTSVIKSVIAGAGASFTEAVLTGANDNVVVPVILWLLVRGLGI
ncbi:hypothetical protein L228DRAFT_219299 [Xylona heveae TC161]|uniref:dolichol kinase n=1 Tax=Xylona heveae (strain CBS 132557 / TC161) TaxID=1328760 RepID=A0A165IEF3_XYLHT|nr:hypothetical protein L228DRAFT_219299 [Xylona heveae TC161]KZF24779.1 hypothetical protein L228DRAFT_219299 [Xylona heveae TC161]